MVQLFKEGALALALRVTGLGLGFLLSMLVARTFGISATGMVALGISLGFLVGQLSCLGMQGAMTKWVAGNLKLGEPGKAVAGVNLSLRVAFPCSFILACLLALLTMGSVGDDQYTTLFLVILIGTSLTAASHIFISALTGLKKSWPAVALEVIPAPLLAVVLFVSIVAVRGDISLWQYAMIWLLATLLGIFVRGAFWFWCAPRPADYPRLELREVLVFSQPFFIGSLAFMSMAHVDTLMLGWISDNEQLGGYAVAFRLAALLTILQSVTDTFTTPRLAEYAATGEYGKVLEIASRSATYLLLLALPLALLLTVLAVPLLLIWGETFTAFAPVLWILILGQFTNVVSGPCGRILLFCGYGKLRNKIALTTLVLDVILNYLLIPQWGAVGAATATSASLVFMYAIFWIVSGRKLGGYVKPNATYLKELYLAVRS